MVVVARGRQRLYAVGYFSVKDQRTIELQCKEPHYLSKHRGGFGEISEIEKKKSNIKSTFFLILVFYKIFFNSYK